MRGPGGSEGERERADAKLGRAGALASGVKGWAGVESGPRGEGERKEVGLMGFLGRLWATGAREETGDRGLSSGKEVGRGLGWNQKKKRVAMGRLGCYLGLGFPFPFYFYFLSYF